jgi:hypothetical protein
MITLLLSLFYIQITSAANTSINLWHPNQESIIIHENQKVSKLLKDGKIQTIDWPFLDFNFSLRVINNSNEQDYEKHCIFKIVYQTKNFFQFMPTSKSHKKEISYKDPVINHNLPEINFFSYDYVIPDKSEETCSDVNKNYHQYTMEKIKYLLSTSTDPLILDIKKDIKKNGLQLLFFKFPFENKTRKKINKIINEDYKEFLEAIQAKIKSKKFINMFMKDVEHFEVESPKKEIKHWKHKLVEFCRNRDQNECKFFL